MTAQSADRPIRKAAWRYKEYTLVAGYVAYKNAQACLILATGEVRPGAVAPGVVAIGTFFEKVDATTAAKPCTVDFGREVQLEYYVNGTGGDEFTAADLFQLAYCLDDQTVGKLATAGRHPVGLVWSVDTHGVAVERSQVPGRGVLGGALTAFVANATALSIAQIEAASVYSVPATGAASTITLPAGARAGDIVELLFDGTLNAHEVTIADATPTTLAIIGPSVKATALCRFDGTGWYVVVGATEGGRTAAGGVAVLPAFVANACAVTAAQINNADVLTVPSTAGASTITLPATGVTPGRTVRIVADGTNNAHTVQIVDATGPTNLTTALTATKRLNIAATFDGTNWYANAYVAP